MRATFAFDAPTRAMPVRSFAEQEFCVIPAFVFLTINQVFRGCRLDHVVEEHLVHLARNAVTMVTIGRTVMPGGVFMSISRNEMPSCMFRRRVGPHGGKRSRSAYCASVVQIFCPLTDVCFSPCRAPPWCATRRGRA